MIPKELIKRAFKEVNSKFIPGLKSFAMIGFIGSLIVGLTLLLGLAIFTIILYLIPIPELVFIPFVLTLLVSAGFVVYVLSLISELEDLYRDYKRKEEQRKERFWDTIEK